MRTHLFFAAAALALTGAAHAQAPAADPAAPPSTTTAPAPAPATDPASDPAATTTPPPGDAGADNASAATPDAAMTNSGDDQPKKKHKPK